MLQPDAAFRGQEMLESCHLLLHLSRTAQMRAKMAASKTDDVSRRLIVEPANVAL